MLISTLKVCIREDVDKHPSLEVESDYPVRGSWEDDWEKTVPHCADSDAPCFILYRLDERDASEKYLWLLISWYSTYDTVEQLQQHIIKYHLR